MKFYSEKLSGNIAIDDTILVKDVSAAAGSRIMDGFKSLFSAEAVVRLESAGYKIAGKTHVGEFGLDLVGEFSHYNPQEGKLYGAAAALVASGEADAALGVDMTGAPRRAAALSDVYFLKPTYGTVSRYGVISCAASGEQIGVYAKNADKTAQIMTTIAGHDDKDGTSLPEKAYTYSTDKEVSKVCIIEELYNKADETIRARIDKTAKALEASGVKVERISCNLFEAANTAWQILMCAETCNNVSRYDGVKFGHRAEKYKNIDELYVNSRTEGFNFLTKAVILYGSDVLSKNRYKTCYDKSLRIRRVVRDAVLELLGSYDAILTPVTSSAEYESYDIHDAFAKVFSESIFTAVPNLIGAPALSCHGVQFIGALFGESTLLSLAKSIERMGE